MFMGQGPPVSFSHRSKASFLCIPAQENAPFQRSLASEVKPLLTPMRPQRSGIRARLIALGEPGRGASPRRSMPRRFAFCLIACAAVWAAAVFFPVAVDAAAVDRAAEGLPSSLTSVEGLQAYIDPLCANPPAEDAADAVTRALCEMETALISLTDGRRTAPLAVLVASHPAHQTAGYQDIGPDVMARTAILFVEERDVRVTFHMCNVRAAIDIAWIRSDGTFIDVQRATPGEQRPPFSCSNEHLYRPRSQERFRYVLETPPGLYERLGLDFNAMRLVLPL